jgi:aminoglycoside phosphotransferase (APT) family kinase protein
MDSFVDVTQTPGELSRIFVQLGLAKIGEIPVATPLTGGVSSGIFRIEVSSGSFCLKQALPQLKVEKEWKVPVDRVFAEIDWLRTANSIVPGYVPKVIGEDEKTKSFVMEFLAAGHSVWKSELLNGHVNVDIASQVGEIIGLIHAATAHSVDYAKRFDNDDNFDAIRLEPYLAETGRVHPEFKDRMDALIARTKANKIALVHGDLSPKNILVGPHGPVILDAECATYGDPAFDVAFCLNHFLIKAAWLPQHLNALMASFDAFFTSYFERVDFEDAAGLEERIATLLPALTLARIDGKSPVEYLTEGSRDAIRTAAISLLSKKYLRLSDVSMQWKLEFSK